MNIGSKRGQRGNRRELLWTTPGSGASRHKDGPQDRSERDATAARHVAPELKGRIVLVPRAEAEFNLQVQLPDFSQLVPDYRHLGELLGNSRCTVAGTAGRPRPRGWLLDGPQTAILQQLPKREEPLLKFEDADVSLQHLFRTDELLPSEHPWLLKITADGSGYTVRSRNVCPGQTYVLLYPQNTACPGPGLMQVKVNCSHVSAWRLFVPQPLPQRIEPLLNRLRLNPSRTVHFCLPGSPDRNGTARDSQNGCPRTRLWIGIRSDHDIRAVTFCLDEDDTIRLPGR